MKLNNKLFIKELTSFIKSYLDSFINHQILFDNILKIELNNTYILCFINIKHSTYYTEYILEHIKIYSKEDCIILYNFKCGLKLLSFDLIKQDYFLYKIENINPKLRGKILYQCIYRKISDNIKNNISQIDKIIYEINDIDSKQDKNIILENTIKDLYELLE